MTSRAVGLIPARCGSKRINGKNIRPLAGHPLMSYSIASALEANVFDKVLVSTDSVEYAEIAQRYGADVLMRPPEFATDTSPDIEWVKHALNSVDNDRYEVFSILRPTSPFRTAVTIQHAMALWTRLGASYDSLRAIEPVKKHPGKMWRVINNTLVPLLLQPEAQPWHSSQLPTLPEVYVQNASLEIAWIKTVRNTGTIAGTVILPFFTGSAQGAKYEGFDINEERDLQWAEHLLREGKVTLPEVYLHV